MGVCLEELYPKLPNGVFFFIFFFSFLLQKKNDFRTNKYKGNKFRNTIFFIIFSQLLMVHTKSCA